MHCCLQNDTKMLPKMFERNCVRADDVVGKENEKNITSPNLKNI